MVAIRKKARKTLKRKPIRAKRKKTRVTIDLPSAEHRRLKAIAAIQGITLQDLIINCVDEKMHHKPNAKTIEVIRKAERGEDLVECEDFDDFIKKLGLN